MNLGPTTNKKVLVTRFEREILSGFVAPATYLTPEGLELLSLTGTVLIVPYDEIKTVTFVRDFEQTPAKRESRAWTVRPKMEGLWVRMRFRDEDVLDGVLVNNLTLLDGYGFTIVPPDATLQNQRLFVPRAAVTDVQVLGVVGSPLRAAKRKALPKEQIDLFDKT